MSESHIEEIIGCLWLIAATSILQIDGLTPAIAGGAMFCKACIDFACSIALARSEIREEKNHE